MYIPIWDISKIPKSSKRQVPCICDCGNPEVREVQRNVLSRPNASCGRCDFFRWKSSGKTSYGSLTLTTSINEIQALRDTVDWDCSCGGKTTTPLFRVMSGTTTSCGCAYKNRSVKNPAITRTREEWLQTLPNLVDDGELPDSWGTGSRRLFKIRCSCGKTYSRLMNGLTESSKCGHCDDIELTSESRFGALVYSGDPVTIGSRTRKKVRWACDCGNAHDISVFYVVHGGQTTCGKCQVIKLETLKGKKWGSLEYIGDTDLPKYSPRLSMWRCACGTEKQIIASNVINGTTKSCGGCRVPVSTWYNVHRNTIRSMRCPIDPSDIPLGGPLFQEIIRNTKTPHKAKCVVCMREYHPRWEGVRLGVGLTCGCASNRISSGAGEIGAFVKSLGVESQLEWEIGGLHYDVGVPSNRLVIEFNGLKWHSVSDSKIRDFTKFRNSTTLGYRHIMIYEDEWKEKRLVIEDIIQNALGLRKSHTKLRASDLEIKEVPARDIDVFYSENHYLGASHSRYNWALFHGNVIVAGMSFRPPSRQSRYDLELSRACIKMGVTCHGGLSRLLKHASLTLSGQSVVSFSDNRLFDGRTYDKLGFKYDGLVRPDYFWVKGSRRYNKSGLRKPHGDERTEGEIRTAEGYERIYDLGKKRWVLNF